MKMALSGVRSLVVVSFTLLCASCEVSTSSPTFPAPAERTYEDYSKPWPQGLSQELYYDKVLGMLLGSAIGDGMGAPTEMWHRADIQSAYGFVTDFTVLDRPRSPEGPWGNQMQAAVTTDDTRWKYLMTQFIEDEKKNLDPVNPQEFAEFIVDVFRQETKELSDTEMSGQAISRELTHLAWLQEWAAVAGPFAGDQMEEYQIALNKFYGGEMSCAGMLYTPILGAQYPGNPDKAYLNAYRLGLFDLGYARDISALCAAYVSKAMQPQVAFDELLKISSRVDPHNYGESRLIGRIADQYASTAQQIVADARSLTELPDSLPTPIPNNYPADSLSFYQLTMAYTALDNYLKDIPFHAGEIHLINLAALAWSEGDFSHAMQFVTNYGRDNDTVGAVTGAILGAYLGASGLPEDMRSQVLVTTRDVVGIDLEELADQLVTAGFTSP